VIGSADAAAGSGSSSITVGPYANRLRPRSPGQPYMISPTGIHLFERSARAKNAMLAGRSASRRIRYPYHWVPYGT
jgi:hypothetical protein